MPPSTTIRRNKTRQKKEGNQMTWHEQAACRGANINLFFEDKGGGAHAYKQARRICGECTVIQKCFEEVMAIEIDPAVPRFGMYAGMTPSQRENYQQHLNRVPAA